MGLGGSACQTMLAFDQVCVVFQSPVPPCGPEDMQRFLSEANKLALAEAEKQHLSGHFSPDRMPSGSFFSTSGVW